MALKRIIGCWEWDGEAACIANSVSGECLRFVGEDAPGSSPWQGRPYLLRYEAADLQCTIAVEVFQEFRSARSGVFWRSMEDSVEMVTLYQVNYSRAAQISGYRQVPFGVWQRLTEFVPEALLFWPHAWPGVDDPADGPGWRDSARSVRVRGVWANGSWREGLGIEFVIERPRRLNQIGTFDLVDKGDWCLADLAAAPESPLVFVDERTAEEAVSDRSPWPSAEGLGRWLAARGNADNSPSRSQLEVPSGLFDKVPHCRSNDGVRYFFVTAGLVFPGRGHSLPAGPSFKLITPDIQILLWCGSLRVSRQTASTDNPKLQGEAWVSEQLSYTSAERSHVQSDHTAVTQTVRRMTWLNILDAFAAWHPAQGIIPALRVRDEWEREKDPGPLLVLWPVEDLKMLPFAWVDMMPPRKLAGIQKASSELESFPWRDWKSYFLIHC